MLSFFKWEEDDTATRNCLFQFCHHFERREELREGLDHHPLGWSGGVVGGEGRVLVTLGIVTKTRMRYGKGNKKNGSCFNNEFIPCSILLGFKRWTINELDLSDKTFG